MQKVYLFNLSEITSLYRGFGLECIMHSGQLHRFIPVLQSLDFLKNTESNEKFIALVTLITIDQPATCKESKTNLNISTNASTAAAHNKTWAEKSYVEHIHSLSLVLAVNREAVASVYSPNHKMK